MSYRSLEICHPESLQLYTNASFSTGTGPAQRFNVEIEKRTCIDIIQVVGNISTLFTYVCQ